jgi:hypothetical protein
VRELLLGPLRFSDLRAGLPGAGPTVLSQRLRELDRTGVVRRRELPASIVYELTAHGAGLEPSGPISTRTIAAGSARSQCGNFPGWATHNRFAGFCSTPVAC